MGNIHKNVNEVNPNCSPMPTLRDFDVIKCPIEISESKEIKENLNFNTSCLNFNSSDSSR